MNKGAERDRDEREMWFSMYDSRIILTNITPDNVIKFMVPTPILVNQKSWGWSPGNLFLK